MSNTLHTRSLPLEEIIKRATALRPEQAVLNFEREWRPYCVSELYMSVVGDDGQVIELSLIDGARCIAIYVRVSLMLQRGDRTEDGYSVEHQLRSSILAAVKEGYAFRIYSDAGLSGFLMTADATLMAAVTEAKAKLYQQIFTEEVLDGAASWNSPEQIADMRRFLAMRVADIRRGVRDQTLDEKPNDVNFERVEDALIGSYQYRNSNNKFRPALHALVEDVHEIHSVYVTDPDRLSRNQVLFVVLGKLFSESKTVVRTSTGTANWMTGSDIGSRILGVVLPNEAENKLVQVKRGAISGIIGMLRQGKPHSILPFWLDRSKKKFACLLPEKLPVIFDLLKLALEDEHIGIERLAQQLDANGAKSPRGGTWQGTTVGDILNNPWLFGAQVLFGREWPMRTDCAYTQSPLVSEADPTYPLALITKANWLVMKNRRAARNQNKAGRPPKKAKRLLAGLVKCRCGYGMIYRLGNEKRHSPPGLKCNAPPTNSKKAKAQGIVHTTLRDDQADAFFYELITVRPDLMLPTRPLGSTDTLDDQERVIKHKWEEIKALKRTEARMMLGTANMKEDTPEFQAAVESVQRALLGDGYDDHKQALERIERMRDYRRATRRPSGDDVEHFADLSPDDQNRVLHSLIKKVTVEGDPGYEYLSIHLREDGIVLPPVYLPTRVYKDGSLHRRVPTLGEWIDSWRAETSSF